jgi:hypothetical protein
VLLVGWGRWRRQRSLIDLPLLILVPRLRLVGRVQVLLAAVATVVVRPSHERLRRASEDDE